MIKALLFDWGNTIMVDYNLPGPMCDWDKVSWVDGAEDALSRMKGVVPFHIASNAPQSPAEKVRLALSRIGADKYFDSVFSSLDIGYEKPDSRFFYAIIEKLGFSPEELVMIGDSYLKDIEGAKKCGIRTVFLNVHGAEGVFPSADITIKGMRELPDAILQMEL